MKKIKKIGTVLFMLLAMIGGALAISEGRAYEQCTKQTEYKGCVVLEEGAIGYVDVMKSPLVKVNYQMQLLKNADDVALYVDSNVASRPILVELVNGKFVIKVKGQMVEKGEEQMNSDIEAIQPVCKALNAPCRIAPKREVVEFTPVEKSPVARELFFSENMAKYRTFGYNWNNPLFGNPVTIGMGKNQARTCFVDENNKIKC